MKTRAAPAANVDDVHPGQPNGVQWHEAFVRHSIAATAHEASHLRQVADEGENATTPAILAGAVLASVIAIAAIVFLVVYGVVHFW